ncbi:hypothetical protein K5V21_13895 [Clostridium sardiniense]|uniref:DnaA N-terminal domain-containing protein n=1 Tax=Clostridium sardiniense TaxID=29369 RepID=A0ABS7L0F3_CLOSR|nr:hypothetical protein [Clostridium sardiniense]MBY0756536.1 hypothetical protein [Clostridium sardiniense]MDQ0460285.1 putative membrane protein YfhO [Clostridium sardiniense]
MDKSSKGFIKLDRAIFEHWIFQDAEKFRAFVDLIQLMRWKDEKLVIGNKVVDIPRGSYYTSELKLAERWGWSRNKTRDYLKLLESEGMIIKKGTAKGTTLSLENYDFYQGEGTTKSTLKKQQDIYQDVQQKNHQEIHQENIEEYTEKDTTKRTTSSLGNSSFYQDEGATKGISEKQQQVQQEVQQKVQQKNIKRYTKEEVKEIKEYKEVKEGEEVKDNIPELEPIFFPTQSCQKIYKLLGENGYRFFMNTDIKEDDNTISIKTKSNVDKTIIAQYIPRIDWQLNKIIEVT